MQLRQRLLHLEQEGLGEDGEEEVPHHLQHIGVPTGLPLLRCRTTGQCGYEMYQQTTPTATPTTTVAMVTCTTGPHLLAQGTSLLQLCTGQEHPTEEEGKRRRRRKKRRRMERERGRKGGRER